jgi:hypothetical protein
MGGLIGHSSCDWLFISVLIIPEALRGKGVGRKLMEQAEQIARTRKLTGIWLDTFDFQGSALLRKTRIQRLRRTERSSPRHLAVLVSEASRLAESSDIRRLPIGLSAKAFWLLVASHCAGSVPY